MVTFFGRKNFRAAGTRKGRYRFIGNIETKCDRPVVST